MALRSDPARSDRPSALSHPQERAEADARSGRGWYAALARAGLVAKGASYALVGVLAFELALRAGGRATSREGALATLAQESFGKIVLVLLALGFAGYAIWRLLESLVGTDEEGAKDWAKRAGYLGRSAIYAALTFSTVKLLMGERSQSQNQEAKETTASALSWPGGQWIVAAAGVAIIGAGAWSFYRGITKKFEDDWRGSSTGRSERRWGARVGLAGHVARGVVFGLIGAFFVKAALEYDPKDAIGLDGALQKIAHADYGKYLLGLAALGLLCYALYCLADARYRDVSAGGGGSSE